MVYRIRALIAVLVIEIGLAITWWWLLQPDETGRVRFTSPDAPVRIGETMGTAMGAVLGFGVLLYFIALKNDRSRRRD